MVFLMTLVKMESRKVKKVNFVPNINWEKVGKEQYCSHVLNSLLKNEIELNNSDLNSTVNIINSVMVESTELCVPRKMKTCKEPPKFRVRSPANALRNKK